MLIEEGIGAEGDPVLRHRTRTEAGPVEGEELVGGVVVGGVAPVRGEFAGAAPGGVIAPGGAVSMGLEAFTDLGWMSFRLPLQTAFYES
jgi:hypothetical protein